MNDLGQIQKKAKKEKIGLAIGEGVLLLLTGLFILLGCLNTYMVGEASFWPIYAIVGTSMFGTLGFIMLFPVLLGEFFFLEPCEREYQGHKVALYNLLFSSYLLLDGKILDSRDFDNQKSYLYGQLEDGTPIVANFNRFSSDIRIGKEVNGK